MNIGSENFSRSMPTLRSAALGVCFAAAILGIAGFAPRAAAQEKPKTPAARAERPRGESVSRAVDAYVTAEMRRERIPGLALGVYRDGRIEKAKGYGSADLEFNAPVKPETLFQSGSMGKQFTATAVMMLVEQGKIGLDDKLTKYFPDAPPGWSGITIYNLLSHTSGIKDYTEVVNLREDYTEDQLAKLFETLPPDFPPGTSWEYSNTNFVLLGIIIHKVTGEFYGDYLHEHIFAPLGMNATRIISEADIIPNRASGYQLVKGQIKNQDWVSPSLNTTADGALYFNVLDLAKWDAALYTTKLLKQSSLDQMWTVAKLNNGQPNKGNYGFGWFITQMNGHRLIEHGGAWQGFTTQISRYVDDKLTVVVLTNLDSAHSQPDKIAHHVAGMYLPALMPPPPPAPIPDTEPQVTEMLKNVLGQLAAGNFDVSLLTADEQKKWTPELQKRASNTFQDFGELQKLELLSRQEDGGVRTYTYRATFAYRDLNVNLKLAAGDKIAGLTFGGGD